jgi:hypothetical protein
MRKEGVTPPVRLDVASLDINIEPVTSGTLKERRWETTNSNILLPAGAYSIHVRHVDPSGRNVNVNGEQISFNQFFSRASREDLVAKKQDFTPEVIIVNPEGKKVAISVSYPSSSNVNPDQL